MKKFTCLPLCGAPRLTTRAVSGTLSDVPWAIQRLGVVTPMSEEEDVALSVAPTD